MNGRPAGDPADTPAVAHVFVDALGDRCEISGDDGHHLQRVRRLAPGETVTAADGTGAWRAYKVREAARGHLTLEAAGDVLVMSSPGTAVSLAVAPTKGGLEDVVASATELGVERIIPVRTARTVVRWDAARAARAVGRLRSIAREASMQSRRVRIPEVVGVVGLGELHTALAPGSTLVVAARDGVPPGALPAPAGPGPGWTVLVGPEGGLDPAELDRLDGVARLRLGAHVLRATTAPVAAVAVLVAEAERRGQGP